MVKVNGQHPLAALREVMNQQRGDGKEALIDFSKYFDFSIVEKKEIKKTKVSSKKEPTLLEQIEIGLREVKLIREGKLKAVTMEELFNEE